MRTYFGLLLLFLNSLTSAQNIKPASDSVRISKDKPEHPVQYKAADSIVYYARTKELVLHRKAEISYDELKVTADWIAYNQDSSTLNALQKKGDSVASDEKPRITQEQESSTFTALRYNFKSKRALVENAYSQYGEGFIHSRQVKRNGNTEVSGFRNIYTTCNEEHPHFGIAARKIKIVPNQVAVSGSANLVIEDIPTPLILPFGLFPLQKGQRSGFKLPTYDMSEQLGFGLRELGYYFALGEHADLLLNTDLYAYGSYRLGFNSSYLYRYRFNGSLSFNYAYTKIGEPYEAGSQRYGAYAINWNHSIHPNIMPGASFNANVNVVSSRNYQRFNSYDANRYLNNNYASNISYSKTWAGKPYNFTASLRHQQNTQTHNVAVTLPELAFSVLQLYPFQFRNDIVKPRWYEKISFSYNFNASNQLTFNDSTFSLRTLRLRDFQNGFKHQIPIAASYNILKYINANTTLNYTERWYTKREFRSYNFNEFKTDTVITDGFFATRYFDVTSTLSTRIYGIRLFRHGLIRGIRHVLTPTLSASYHPDFGSGIAQYYYNTLADSNYTKARYSYYDGSLFGVPPDGKFGGLHFGLGNTLQMKVRNRKDTLNGIRKVNLIDGLDFSGSYNFVVDSFQWSTMNVRYRTTLLDNIGISGSLLYDPYAIDSVSGRRMSKTEWKTNHRLLRFRSAEVSVRAHLPTRKQNTALNKASEEQKTALGTTYSRYADFNVPWNLDVNYSISLNKNYLVASRKDTLVFDQNLNFSGDVNLTPKWKIGISSGYDFRLKQMTYTSFEIFRDLHCWEMHLNLIPFGYLRSYNFTLNVKSSVLQDLKLVRRKDFRDNL